MPQTSVATAFTVGIPGQLADLNSMTAADVLSKVNAEASASIPFGVMLAAGSGDGDAELLAATSDLLIGVSVFSHGYEPGKEVDDDGVLPDTCFGVLNVGRVWVTVEEAVTPASDVRVRAVAAGAEVKGAFRATADGTDCIDVSAFCRYLTSAAQDGLALVEIDMRNRNLAVADT